MGSNEQEAFRKLRIAFITHAFPRLHNTFILTEITELIRMGHDVDIYSLQKTREKILNKDIVRFNLLERTVFFDDFLSCTELDDSLRRYGENFGKITTSFAAIAEVLKNKDTDIIHAIFGNRPATAAFLLSKLSGIPYTFETHTFDLFVDFPFAKEKITKALFVATESNYNRNFFSTVCPDLKNKIEIIHLAPNKDMLDRVGPLERKDKLIVSACRLVEIKGLKYAISAFAKIYQDNPDCHYIIIGDGPERARLESLVSTLGLRNAVSFVGDIPNEEVARVVQQATIFLLPCVIGKDGDRDGTPTALAEAMYLETPVISTNITGIPELVEDGVSGFLCDPHNIAQLENRIHQLLADPNRRTIMGKHAKAKIDKEYNIKTSVERYIELWTKHLAASNSPLTPLDYKPVTTRVISEQDQLTNALANAITNFSYHDAAHVFLAMYNREQNCIIHLEEAAYFLLLAENYKLAKEVALLACSKNTSQSPKLIRLLCWSLLFERQVDDAEQVIAALKNHDASAWINRINYRQFSDFREALLQGDTEFRPTLTDALSYGNLHALEIVVKSKCKECGTSMVSCCNRSIFKIVFQCCQNCAHPYVILPTRIADLLESKSNIQTISKLKGIDIFCWGWANSWFKNLKLNNSQKTAIKYKSVENLFEHLYFNIRYILGEHYSKIFSSDEVRQ